MTNVLIKKSVDIYTFPATTPNNSNEYQFPTTQHETVPQLTIGDLHGNAIKLLFVLFYHGIASGIEGTEYAALVKIYQTKTSLLTVEHLEQFKHIINKIQFKKTLALRLIGDVLADRGSNDYFTLLVLGCLKEAGVAVDIIASNHDMEFILNFISGIAQPSSGIAQPRQYNIVPAQSESMYNLANLIKGKLVEEKEIVELLQRSYFPNFKLLDYGLDKDKNAITIHSHAPIGLETIREVANELGVTYLDSSAGAIAFTIENINEAFRRSKEFSKLFTQREGCFFNLLWKRGSVGSQRPFQLGCGDRVDFVHGHDNSSLDMYPDLDIHTHNLDNVLGKDIQYGEGRYTAIYGYDQTRLTAQEFIDFTSKHNFSDSFEDNCSVIQLNKLKRLLPRIIDKKTQVAAENLLNYITANDDGADWSQLRQVLEKANELLESSSADRKDKLSSFRDLAKDMVGEGSMLLQGMGILMMTLAAVIAVVVGTLLAAGTFGLVIPAGLGGLGLATGLAGVGFFANSGATGLAGNISELAAAAPTKDEQLISAQSL